MSTLVVFNRYSIMMLTLLGLVSCGEIDIDPASAPCSEEQKEDYHYFVMGSKAVVDHYESLKNADFILDDWESTDSTLTAARDSAETGRVRLENFCEDIKTAFHQVIEDKPQFRDGLTRRAMVTTFGIHLSTEQAVSAFQSGSLRDALSIGDTLVLYPGEQHLPYTKSATIERYNSEIREELGQAYTLPIRGHLHYCAIDAFPVFIGRQLQMSRPGNVEARDFLAGIAPMMAEYAEYLQAIPENLP